MSKNVVDMTLRANMDLSQVSSGLNQMQGILKQLKLSPTLKKEFDNLFSTAAADLEKYQAKLQSGFKTKGDITGFEKIAQGLEKSLDKIGAAWSKLQEKDLSKLVKLDSSAIEQIQQIENKFKELEKTLKGGTTNSLKTVVEQINSLSTKTSKQAGLGVAEALGVGEYKEALALIDEYITKLERMGATARGGKYYANLQIFQQMRKGVASVISETDEYNQKVNELKTDKLTVMADAVDKTSQKLQQGSAILSGVTQKTHEYSKATQESAQKTVELGNDLDMLKNRVQYFFSLTNSVMLFRKILQDTIQTTKELDAAMTETAVVTDFSIADMWKDLPRYTATAKELGATIQGVYETMTLYYQQGLKTNEVFEVGTETLKMARIAGLDYAQATDFMTAALRGFNMEVNELNSQRVNDVYSELAAITAADTQEIATAMTKTASIASNANMEFETTAAFLSQIIETTRESAETAGTAMKTVIARFTELKKDPAEIGEVDGEIVDANKIETALRTIDVALRDTSGQFRDLDDVFLDIAEKWDGLDTNTQRYIATMAAGSRQQSRFIAMMSDYGRTMELVNAANNSAGASQKQFDKTLESLESKLNQLKDAWDQFTMGIANNTLIKGGIDALTGLLNIINKLTEGLPGATKGIGNLLLMIGGFSAGGKVFRAFSASVLADLQGLSKGAIKAGEHVGDSFITALSKEFKTTKKIFSLENLIGTVPQAEIKDFSDRINKSILKSNKELEVRKGQAARFAASGRDTSEFDKNTEKLQKQYEALTKTQQAYDKASMTQKSAYLALLDAQVPKDMALLALQKELTEEDYRELAIKSLLATTKKAETELTEEEIKARQQAIISKQTEYSVDKMGILTKAKYIALLLFGNKNTREEAVTKLAAAGATWAQKAAQDGLNASMFAFPIGWILAGIAALTIALVALAKWSKTQTLEYKMEKAAEATEKAKEAAENAKQAYDDLNTSIEEIGTKESELEKLTYGTLEWQKALLDVNQQVMDLIDQFPNLRNQLLNELTVNADGKLTLSIDGYNMIKSKTLEQYKNAFSGQMASSTYEAALKQEKAKLGYESTNFEIAAVDKSGQAILKKTAVRVGNAFTNIIAALGAGMAGETVSAETALNWNETWTNPTVTRVATNEEKQLIKQKWEENPEIFRAGDKDLEEFARGLGLATEGILAFVPSLRDLDAANLEYEASVRASAKQLLLTTAPETFKVREDSKEIADTYSQIYAEQQKNDIQKELDKMGSMTDIADYASDLGLDNFINQGSELLNLQKMYQELTGATKEQVEEMFGEGKEELRQAIATIKVGKDWGKRVDAFAKDLDNFNKNLPKNEDLKDLENVGPALKQLFGGANGAGFTKDGLSTFVDEKGNINQANLETILSNFYKNSPTIKQQYEEEYGIEEAYNEFKKWASEMITTSQQAFVTAEERLSSLNLKVSEFASGLDSGATVDLSKKIEDVFYKTGEAGAESLVTQFNAIIESFGGNEAQIKNFTSALLGLDWSSVNDIKNFGEVLKKLGVEIDENVLDNFTSDIIEFNEASNAVKLENLTAELEKLNGIAENLAEREYNDFEFTREERDALIGIPGINEEDFVGYADTWMYLGDSITNLITAVNENTSAIIGDTIKELEEQHKTASFLDNPETDTGDLANYGFLSLEDRQNILNSLVTQAQNANLTQLGGYDIGQLAKLATASDPDTYQQDKLSAVLEQLASLLGQSGLIGDKINTIQHEDAVQQYAVGPMNTMTQDALAETNGGAATDALLAEAKAYTQLNDEVAKYNELIKAGKKELANKVKQEIAAGVAIADAAKKINKYRDEINDTIDALEDMDKESLVYEESLEDIASMLSEMFDADFDVELISGDNIENLELLQEGLAGSQPAWEQFIKNIAIARLESSKFAEQFQLDANQISGISAALDNINFSVDGTADMSDVINELINCGATAEMIATFIELLSQSSIEFSTETEEMELPDGTTITVPKSFQATSSYVPAASMGSQFGGGSSGGGSGGGGSGGDSGSEEEPWENPYDSFYNIAEEINELLDKRNELEKEYDLLLKNENSSINDFINNYKDRLASYYEEIALQKEVLKMRQDEQDDILSRNSHLSDYAWVENGAVYIDFEAIDQVEDQELGEEIEEYIDALEENDEAIQEANDAIQENTLAIEDLMDEWRNTAADFEQRVYDALVKQREEEIEKTEEIFGTLSESNNDLIDAIQKQINLQRQERENEETEKDIAEKEKRLAFLSQDTSGAYDQEVLQLQKELTNQKEDYTDTLIDQKISELQEQNEEAERQRDKQIQIMQYQLQNDQKTGAIAQEVKTILQDANSTNGWKRVWGLLEEAEGFKSLTDTNKAIWTEDTQSHFKQAMAYIIGGEFTQNIASQVSANIDTGYIGSTGSDGDGTSSDYDPDDGSEVGDGTDSGYDPDDSEGEAEKDSNEGVDDFVGSILDGVEDMMDNIEEEVKKANTKTKAEGVNLNGTMYYQDTEGKWYKSTDLKNITNNTFEVPEGVSGRSSLLTSASKNSQTLSTATSAASAKSLAKEKLSTKDINGTSYYVYNGVYYTSDQLVTKKSGQKYQAYLSGGYVPFKTGGLADFTGPAWLDGTKSKPELVLNQKDTQNFLRLKDILGSFMKNSNNFSSNNSIGDTTYDISINVDKVTSDYDVDQIASKIKQIIVNDSMYRNSNLISRTR